jgi:hypothetical protein
MRGRWLAVAGLTLMTVLIGAPQASAQTLPPEVTSNVTCETVPATGAKYVKLGASIKNPNTVAVTYTLVRTWSDGRTPNIQAKAVAAGATVDANLLDNKATSVATQWTYTMVVKVDGAEGTTVAGPFTSQNPCMNPPGVTYTVTCTKNSTSGAPEAVVYAPTIKNPNTVAVTFTLVRSWSDGRADVTSTAEVAAGATAAGGTLDYMNSTALTTDWTHTLTIKIGDSVIGTPITKQNPCFTAPTPTTDPPEVSYEVTCQKNGDGVAESVLYAPTIKNPNTVAVTYTLVLDWSDERAEQTADVPVAAGATMSGEELAYTDKVALTAEWTNTLTVKEGAEVVAGPISKENPCFTEAPPTSTTTTDPATSTTNVATTSSNSGGLAATGVAVVVVLGVGLVLFANGAGLMRLVRKGEHE